MGGGRGGAWVGLGGVAGPVGRACCSLNLLTMSADSYLGACTTTANAQLCGDVS